MCRTLARQVLFLGLMLSGGALSATVFHVGPGGDDLAGDGSAARPWRSLTRALSAAQAGDEIQAAAGLYDGAVESFPLVLPDGVVLVGAGPGLTVVDATATGFTSAFQVGSNLLTTVLRDCSILGNRYLVQVTGTPADLRIRHCELEGGMIGIYRAFGALSPSSLSVSACTISDFSSAGIYWLASGSGLADAQRLELRHTIVDGGGSMGTGVLAGTYGGEMELEAEGNTIRGARTGLLAAALRFSGGGGDAHFGGRLTGNGIRGCSGVGMAFYSYAFSGSGAARVDPEIRYNSVRDNGSHGVWVLLYAPRSGQAARWESLVEANSFTGNHGSGVMLTSWNFGSLGTVLAKPRLETEAGGGFGRNTLRDNDGLYLTGSQFDWHHTGPESLPALGNWWGTEDPLLIGEHVWDGADEEGLGLVDYASRLVAGLAFEPEPMFLDPAGGQRVLVKALPGSAFVPRSGADLLQVFLDDIPLESLEVAEDGSWFSFVAPPLPADATLTLRVGNPGGQSGSSFLVTAAEPAPAVSGLVPPAPGGQALCFVATASYGDVDAPEVMLLRSWRDRCLANNVFGRQLIRSYYDYSPPLAEWLSQSAYARALGRLLLAPVAGAARLWMEASWVYALAGALVAWRALRRRC